MAEDNSGLDSTKEVQGLCGGRLEPLAPHQRGLDYVWDSGRLSIDYSMLFDDVKSFTPLIYSVLRAVLRSCVATL